MLRARSPLYAAMRGKMLTRIDWSSRSSSVKVAACVERTNEDRALSQLPRSSVSNPPALWMNGPASEHSAGGTQTSAT